MAEAGANKESVLSGGRGGAACGDSPVNRMAAFRTARAVLESSGADSPAIDALALMSIAESMPQVELLSEPRAAIGRAALDSYMGLVSRRAAGEPLGRISGRKEFLSLDFEVGPGVFMPRFETEALAEMCIDRLGRRAQGGRPAAMLDLCTGSGVLAVCAAVRVPGARVAAADISAAALNLAARNAAAHGVSGRIRFLEGDLFGALAGLAGVPDFDVIAANPPYVPTGSIRFLQREVRLHDPVPALDGGPDGAGIVRAIIAGSPALLREGGALLLEIGGDQADAALSAAGAAGSLRGARVEKDLSGVPRYFMAEKS